MVLAMNRAKTFRRAFSYLMPIVALPCIFVEHGTTKRYQEAWIR